MMDEDKTREQLIADLSQLRQRLADAQAGASRDAHRAAEPHGEDMLRAIHRSPAVTIVWRAGDGWPVSFVSESIRRYGHIPQDLVGLADHGRYVSAQDLPAFVASFVEANGARQARSVTREYRLLARSGEERWVQERLWIERDESGRITHFTGLLSDIHGLRQLEAAVRERDERLAALFEHATRPILLHAVGGECIDANRAASDHLGYGPDELLRVPLEALLGPETCADIQRLTRGVPGARETMLQGELVGRDGAGLPALLECRLIELGGDRAILTLVHPQRPDPRAAVASPPDNGAMDALRRRIEEVDEANRAIAAEREALAAQQVEHLQRLRQQEVLLHDVHHRVKNNLQVISSLLGLQAEYIDDPRALEAFAESQHRVRAVALVHERVYQSADLARVDLAAYIRDLVERLFVALGADPGIALHMDVDPVSLPTDTAIPCGLLISELVSNSVKHAFPGGRGSVSVTLRRQDDQVIMAVADDGVGLPEGLDYRHTESLGLQLVAILAQQLEASVDVDTSAGTRFSIAFRDGDSASPSV